MAKRKGPGRSHRKGLTVMEAVRMFSDEAEVERCWSACAGPAASAARTAVGPRERAPDAQAPAVPLQLLPQGFQRQDRHRHARLQDPAVQMGDRGVPHDHRPQGRVEHEAAPRPRRLAEDRLAPGAPDPQGPWESDAGLFSGPAEVDETYVGGKERNRRSGDKLREGPLSGKSIVAGAKDRATGKVSAVVVDAASSKELKGFIRVRVAPGAEVYTDGHSAYRGLPNHSAVMHSRGEYVRWQGAHERDRIPLGALKRGIVGTYHQVSMKHLNRYLAEFEGRHNVRPHDTIDQIAVLVRGKTASGSATRSWSGRGRRD